jgi:hypothetical protein
MVDYDLTVYFPLLLSRVDMTAITATNPAASQPQPLPLRADHFQSLQENRFM